MPHYTPLVSTVVMGLVLAFILGTLAHRLRVSPIAGYLLAGVVVGPFTPGFVANQELAGQLAEIGVILLMFGVGLHFSLRDLLSVRAIAIPGALVQISCATGMGMGLAWLLGWPLPAGIVFGLALSVASTVVLLRALQERRLVDTERGRIAVGWLIVEDIAMVLALVILPALGGALDGSRSFLRFLEPLVIALGTIAGFVILMLVVGRRIIPWALHYAAHTGSRELFRLAVLAIALGTALGAAEVFGVSFALGAFFAGMILSESELSQRAAQETLPLRDAFAVLFFVSVGMLVDPMILVDDYGPVLATFFIIVIGKSVAAFAIVRAFGHPRSTAFTIAASLAQIGEFSFILMGLGIQLEMLPQEGSDLILAGAILSIMVNPFLFVLLDRWTARVRARAAASEPTGQEDEAAAAALAAERQPSAPAPEALVGMQATEEAEPAEREERRARPDVEEEPHVTELSDHVVLVGHGRVGQFITGRLGPAPTGLVVVDLSSERLAELAEAGVETVIGNAADPRIATAANIAGARCLLVAIPDAFECGQVIAHARRLNPDLPIVVRADGIAEERHLDTHGATRVVQAQEEVARAMVDHLPPAAPPADAAADQLAAVGSARSQT